jgi:hypothetical protein
VYVIAYALVLVDAIFIVVRFGRFKLGLPDLS